MASGIGVGISSFYSNSEPELDLVLISLKFCMNCEYNLNFFNTT